MCRPERIRDGSFILASELWIRVGVIHPAESVTGSIQRTLNAGDSRAAWPVASKMARERRFLVDI